MRKLLTPQQAAEFLGLTNHETLAVWRCTRRYDLPYVKVGGRVRYLEEDLLNFLEARKVSARLQPVPRPRSIARKKVMP